MPTFKFGDKTFKSTGDVNEDIRIIQENFPEVDVEALKGSMGGAAQPAPYKTVQDKIFENPNYPDIIKKMVVPEKYDETIPNILSAIPARAENFTNALGANLPKHLENLAAYAGDRVTGGEHSYGEISNAQQQRRDVINEKHPLVAGESYLEGLLMPFGAMNKALKVGEGVATAAKTAPSFLGKMLSGPFVQGAIKGGVSNLLYGQAGADLNSSLGQRTTKGAIDTAIGGALGGVFNKVGDVVSGKLNRARAPQEVQKLLTQLDEQFSTIKDPAERSQAIQDFINNAIQNESGKVAGSGEAIKSGLENEINQASNNIKSFYNTFTGGKATPAQVTNAKDYLQGFFQKNGFMNKAGNWVNEAGQEVESPVVRYGAGQTSGTQQNFLFDRWNDLFRNPELSRLHDLKQTIQADAYKGADPLFSGGSKHVVRGLTDAIKTDEEAAIRNTYGDKIAEEFLGKKQAFKEAIGPIKAIGKRVGLMNDAGEFAINSSPEQLISKIAKLPPEDMQKLIPVLERQGVLDQFPQIKEAFGNIDALETVGKPSNYQNLGKKLADNPNFFKSLQTSKNTLPPEALNQIKADYIERIVGAAKGNNAKIAESLGKLSESSKKMLFSEEEIALLNQLQTKSATPTEPGFLGKMLRKIPVAKYGPELSDTAIQSAPDNVINFLKRVAEMSKRNTGVLSSSVSNAANR